jgi:hypothetical protein
MEGSRRRNHLLWIAPLVTLAGALTYFSFFARFPPLRDFPWVNLPLVALGLALTVVAAARPWLQPQRFRGKGLGAVALAVSALVAAGFGAYVFAISSWVPAPTALTTSLEKAPDVAGLSAYRGRSVVLVFYRGYW